MKTDTTKLVTFRLGGELFAANIAAVERVLRYARPSAVPDAPQWVEGVIEHGGAVAPVIDLRRRIELPDAPITPQTRILVFATSAGPVGAIVDSVLEVAMVPSASIAPPPALFRGLSSQFVSGVAKVHDCLTVILDVDRIVTSLERVRFEASIAASAQPAAHG